VRALGTKSIGQSDHEVSAHSPPPLSRQYGERTRFNLAWTARHGQSACLRTVAVGPEVRNDEDSSSGHKRAKPRRGQHTVKQCHCFQT
jgi:hypothetical protein